MSIQSIHDPHNPLHPCTLEIGQVKTRNAARNFLHGNAYVFTKYILVGGINTLFGYSVFALLVYIGLIYAVALLIATIIGILFNFKSTGILVFESHDNRLIFRFIAVYCVLYIINLLGLKAFATTGLNIYAAAALTLPLTAVIGFLANKRLVFKK